MARVIFFVAILSAAAVQADEPVKIPLKDIWAYRMSGTKDVRELQPEAYEQSLPTEEQTKRLRQAYTQRLAHVESPNRTMTIRRT
jgi:hypothetical protein